MTFDEASADVWRGDLPFSFVDDGHTSAELIPQWQRSATSVRLPDSHRSEYAFADPATGLHVSAEVTVYDDFSAVEWLLRFRNDGAADTPILADILPLDTAFALPADKGCRLHYAKGSQCRIDDFAPQVADLNPTAGDPQGPWIRQHNPFELRSRNGRSSDGTLPFFNLEMDGDRGIIGAIGWTGDWLARFWRADDGAVRVQAGMPRTHLKLQPGEEIRSPRMVLFFSEGDRIDAHNRWRQFLLAHHTPTVNGKPLRAPRSLAVWGENRAERQIGKVRWLVEHEIPVDNFWIDAGWHGEVDYKDNATVFNSAWGRHVGNWYPNATAYPNGLAPVGDAVHDAGMNFTLWFEPERVFAGTQFTKEHPEWLLGPIGENYLFNLGNHEARQALTDLISAVIEEGQITCYRQDFNTAAAPYWQAADAPDRVGMSEIRHIEGLYAFWDELRERHPNLFIDNCSSGGRRIDLETASRSIPLWRSDYQCFPDFDPIGLQGQTHGLSPWVPLSTGCCDRQDTYAFRSALGPGIVLASTVNSSGDPEGYLTPWQAYDAEWLKGALQEASEVQPYFLGDFYPLLSYSLEEDAWAAWQFDRPDLQEGMVVAFRRQRSPFPQLLARLRGLQPEAVYEVSACDGSSPDRITGAALMTRGVLVSIDEAPGSYLMIYRRV